MKNEEELATLEEEIDGNAVEKAFPGKEEHFLEVLRFCE